MLRIKIKMGKLEKIKIGDVFNNQKELYRFLGLPENKKGDSKKALDDEISRYLIYKKIGNSHKIEIIEVKLNPSERAMRHRENNNKWSKVFNELILSEDWDRPRAMNYIISKVLGASYIFSIQQHIRDIPKYKNMHSKAVYSFEERMNRQLRTHIIDALDRLQKKECLQYKKVFLCSTDEANLPDIIKNETIQALIEHYSDTNKKERNQNMFQTEMRLRYASKAEEWLFDRTYFEILKSMKYTWEKNLLFKPKERYALNYVIRKIEKKLGYDEIMIAYDINVDEEIKDNFHINEKEIKFYQNKVKRLLGAYMVKQMIETKYSPLEEKKHFGRRSKVLYPDKFPFRTNSVKLIWNAIFGGKDISEELPTEYRENEIEEFDKESWKWIIC